MCRSCVYFFTSLLSLLGCSVVGSWRAFPCKQQSAFLALWARSLWSQALCLEGCAEGGQPVCGNSSRSFARGQQRQVRFFYFFWAVIFILSMIVPVVIVGEWLKDELCWNLNGRGEYKFSVKKKLIIKVTCLLWFSTVLHFCWNLQKNSCRLIMCSSVFTRAVTTEVRLLVCLWGF